MSTYEISKSSLLSLKAEIIRKQEEVNKSKLQTKPKRNNKCNSLGIKGTKKTSNASQLKEDESNSEDEDLLKKSREALKAKSKLYDQLSKKSFNSNDREKNKHYLVCFDKKGQHSNEELECEFQDVTQVKDSDDDILDDYEPAANYDEEWVEYVDCLGRTRLCLRKDLKFLKEKDADLRVTVSRENPPLNTRENQVSDNLDKAEEESTIEPDITSSDIRKEQLRQQWELEEEELLKKNTVHYQDILFDEARTHGVGYYGFSKDEEERSHQQDALKQLRKETELEQRKAQELKNLREKQIKSRAKAARNRKRSRMGLPPEEDEPEELPPSQNNTPIMVEPVAEDQLLVDKLKEKARKEHVRPWDVGKEGVKTKNFYEYTQEEWVDKQRTERNAEFAPPIAYSKTLKNDMHSLEEPKERQFRGVSTATEYTDSNFSLYFTTKAKDNEKEHKSRSSRQNIFSSYVNTDKKFQNTFSTQGGEHCDNLINDDHSEYDEQDRLLQDYKCITKLQENDLNPFQSESEKLCQGYKHTNEFKPTPISDECSSEINNDNLYEQRNRGVEIPPPTIFEHNNSNKATKQNEKRKIDTEESIMAGLKFLRHQVEKKKASTNHPSEMFLL